MNATHNTNTRTVDGLTPQQKAAETRRRRKAQELQSIRDSSADLPIALLTLRKIRDDPAASSIEKILAIALLSELAKR